MPSRTTASTTLADYITTNPRNAAVAQILVEPKYKCGATQTYPLYDLLLPGEPVAIDIEFQHYKSTGYKGGHRLGRPTIVNTKGEVVLDVYAAYPREEGVSKRMPPEEYNVDKRDLLFHNGAVAAHKVERWIKNIVQGRKVIMHGGKHDMTAFQFATDVWAGCEIVDTQQEFSHLQRDGTPGLQTCAAIVLSEMVQMNGHSPVEDAVTTLKLWQRKYPDAYDRAAAEAAIRQEQVKVGPHPTCTSLSECTDTAIRSRSSGRNNSNTRHSTDTSPSALHGRAVLTAKQTTETKARKTVQEFKLSLEDDDAFPALGALVPVQKRR